MPNLDKLGLTDGDGLSAPIIDARSQRVQPNHEAVGHYPRKISDLMRIIRALAADSLNHASNLRVRPIQVDKEVIDRNRAEDRLHDPTHLHEPLLRETPREAIRVAYVNCA